jgi:hypothetical protein
MTSFALGNSVKIRLWRSKAYSIGIDRYASSHIRWLSCAARDATALYAVFGDMLSVVQFSY